MVHLPHVVNPILLIDCLSASDTPFKYEVVILNIVVMTLY